MLKSLWQEPLGRLSKSNPETAVNLISKDSALNASYQQYFLI